MSDNPESPFDTEKVDNAVLALLALTRFTEHGITRAWKGHDWEALNRLHVKGYISDPVNKNKSVVMTEEGARRSQELFDRYFGNRKPAGVDAGEPEEVTADVSTTRPCSECGQAIPEARLLKVPDARFCVACQEKYERTHDTRPHIDEGLAGSREDHKRMRAKQWGDMARRSRE